MASVQTKRETVADLRRHTGKAELIGGRVVPLMPTGRRPNRIAGRIFRSLDDHACRIGRGEAYTDNIGYVIPELPSGRQSFSPDASYFEGPFLGDPMEFIHGPPTFAAEVRSENDYGPAAELELAAKRADYFAAGTRVVWDVDPVNELIHIYHASNPDTPMTCKRGQQANAELAVPGWTVAVDWIFS